MQNSPGANAASPSGEIDLLALLGALIDRKWIIIACTALFAIIGIAYAILSTPVYVANAVIQIEEKSAGVGSLLGSTGDMFARSSSAVTEIELIKSRSVIGQAVDNLQLDIIAKPRLFPVIGPFMHRRFSPTAESPLAQPPLGLDSFAWGGEKLRIFQFDVPERWLGTTLTLRAEGPEHFSVLDGDQLLVSGAVGEQIAQNGFEVQVAELIARPGTEFQVTRQGRLRTIIDYQAALGASERGRDSGILTLSVESPNPAHAAAVLNEISRLYVRQNVERKSAEAKQSLDFLREQLPQVRREVERAEAALNAYQSSAGSVNISIETQAVLNQVVELDTAISEQMLRREELQRRFTRDHPSYQALMSQIAQLEDRRARLVGRVGDLPETQQELLRLARDVEVSTEIYTQMLNRTQELDIVRAGTVGNVRIIDSAEVDTSRPVRPKKPLIVVLATLLGAMLGVALALIRHALNRGIENAELIEQLGLPVYATIPFSKDQQVLERSFKGKGSTRQGSHLLVSTNPADLAVESLRSLRTSLHFAMMEAKNNVLMISGPSPGIGKSFVSANLAALLADAGQKVLLIDGDMRKGYVHKLMNAEAEPGLSALLAATASLADVTHQTEVTGLDFIARGRVPPNPSELLMHANFEALIAQLKDLYDLVIIDTPPILAVTDAALVGRLAGTSLIVTRYGVNPLKEVEATLQRFRNNGVEIKGAIFNAVERKAGAYGYYGNYQYAYQSDAK